MFVSCEKGVLRALDQVRIATFCVDHQLVKTVLTPFLNAPSSTLLLMRERCESVRIQCVQESYQNSPFHAMLSWVRLN